MSTYAPYTCPRCGQTIPDYFTQHHCPDMRYTIGNESQAALLFALANVELSHAKDESQAAPDRPRDCGPTSDRSVAREASEIDTVRWTAGASGVTLGELWRGEFERLTARIAELEEMLTDHVKALECSRDLLIRALPCVEDHDRADDCEQLAADIREALGE